MASSYKITFSVGKELEAAAGFSAKVATLLNQAVRAIAQQTVIDWQKAVHGAKLWSGEKDAYAGSIKYEMTGDFSAYVSADYKHADEIETGRPPRDLKRMLDTSLKVRRNEGGKRFLVIPFRHNTPGNNALSRSMPASVYSMAKSMTPSVVNNVGLRETGQRVKLSPHTGMTPLKGTPYLSDIHTKKAVMTKARLYGWGGRLTAGAMKAQGIDAETRKRYAGMVKMDTSTPGGSKSSAYMTFRIMMEGSKGWIVPAQPGQYLLKKTVEDIKPKAEKAFAAAVKKTMTG